MPLMLGVSATTVTTIDAPGVSWFDDGASSTPFWLASICTTPPPMDAIDHVAGDTLADTFTNPEGSWMVADPRFWPLEPVQLVTVAAQLVMVTAKDFCNTLASTDCGATVAVNEAGGTGSSAWAVPAIPADAASTRAADVAIANALRVADPRTRDDICGPLPINQSGACEHATASCRRSPGSPHLA